MKKKSIFCLSLVLSLILISFAACSSDDGSNTESPQKYDGGKLEIRFYEPDISEPIYVSMYTDEVTLTVGQTYTLEFRYSTFEEFAKGHNTGLTVEYDTEYMSLEHRTDDEDDYTFWFVGLAETESAKLSACIDDREREVSVTFVGSEE